MGKPKKAQAKSAPDKYVAPKDLGNKVMYIGLGGARKACAFCGKTFKKKMMSEFKGKHFCNENCVKAYNILLDDATA
jgi:hypothetical protein